MTMQSLKPAVLLGALLITGMLAGQTPEAAPNPAQAPAAPAQAPAAVVQSPNPGQGGVPTEAPAPLTHEQQEAKVKADAARVSELQAQALARQLNLTAAQVVQLKPILAERQKKLRDTVSQAPDSLPDRRAKLEQIQAETQAKIKGILYPPQKALFEKLLASRRGGRSIRTNRPAGTSMAPGVRTAPTRPKGVIQPAAPAAPPATPATPAPPAAAPQSK
jgi:hypothetical protein